MGKCTVSINYGSAKKDDQLVLNGLWLSIKDLHTYTSLKEVLLMARNLQLNKNKSKAACCIVVATLWKIGCREMKKYLKGSNSHLQKYRMKLKNVLLCG
ncbi:hypothetical protein Hdeb2414_s0006g00195971 [Helianthus debilis subsp. tardiflorus]